MKKTIIYLLAVVVFSLFAVDTLAQSPTTEDVSSTVTPSVIATPSGGIQLEKAAQDLKNKIVNKVAEIQKKEQKAIAGVITKLSSDQLTLKTSDDQEIIVKIDSALTKINQINGTNINEIKLDSLLKNDYVIVTGPLIDKTITANSVYKDEQYFAKSGKVTEVNKSDYYLKVLTADKDNLTLDIETFTKMQLLNIKTLELERSGFSKLKEGDTVHFIYKKTGEEKEANRFAAQKILIVPQEYFMK
jgi:hypothetical protein